MLPQIAFYLIVFGFLGYGIYRFVMAVRNPPEDIDKEIKEVKKQIELKKLKGEVDELRISKEIELEKLKEKLKGVK